MIDNHRKDYALDLVFELLKKISKNQPQEYHEFLILFEAAIRETIKENPDKFYLFVNWVYDASAFLVGDLDILDKLELDK